MIEPALEEMEEVLRPGGLALTERVFSFCSLPAQARVLDIGCGAGKTVEHLIFSSPLRAYGVDPSWLMVRTGRQRNPVLPLIQARGERLPIAGGKMDLIIAECSLSVMANPGTVLAESHRILRTQGVLAISDLYARDHEGLSQLRASPGTGCLNNLMTEEELRITLATYGFRLFLWEDHSRLLKSFLAQLMLSSGATEEFCLQGTIGNMDVNRMGGALAKARIGYFLVLARKLDR